MRLFTKALLFLIFSYGYVANAQFDHAPSRQTTTDSILYYKKKISDLYKRTWDSLRQSETYLEAAGRLRHHTRLSNGYTSFTVFGDVARASYNAVNSGIAQSGFPALSGPQYHIGIGTSHEYHNRGILEFYIFTIGLSNVSKKGDETVKSSFSNLFQVNFGYDFIKSQKINIYPYTGLALRLTNLNYKMPAQTNNAPTSIVDIVQNDGSVIASKGNLSYQAGLGMDFVIHESARGTGTMLFLRAGTDGIFGNTTFKIDDKKYDAQIKQGAWIFAFGFKFFSRD
jgi:hypothetical protein